ncbi:MAG: alpha-L-fucosidase [Bacteroidales bacterium]|nr:alpha-L-fucosidase [Bacteroidales bacterium]
MYRTLLPGIIPLLAALLLLTTCDPPPKDFTAESPAEKDRRMEWWREARFGMFIHWGLYAIPAGEWKGETHHAEWIRTTAQIPLEEYDLFRDQFNPVRFRADEWVKMAKNAGMKYMVITSKHHDGFCLFDSKHTDFDVMSTPFERDILKELSDACREEGIKMCWYHSIMDWRHPDYLPRRDWETDRPEGDADMDRFMVYLKNQLAELVGNYGEIGVLWFDGEWEGAWKHEHGRDLYNFVRNLQPSIIINNRVDKGRSGMAGLTREGGYMGDFGTPEQEIPETGLPGVDWESCMTMNDHWGYNQYDNNWKSTSDLIRKLADIASKGGNFLLNVGPKPDGSFPEESVERLNEIGAWMKINGEAIYGTSASPFRHLSWGRCTQKQTAKGTRLYLHVFELPENRLLRISGLYNDPEKAFLLLQPDNALAISRDEDALLVQLPASPLDTVNTVVVLEINGKPDVSNPPQIRAAQRIFTDTLQIRFLSERENVEIRYTLNGTLPTAASQPAGDFIVIENSSAVSARCFRNGTAVSDSVTARFVKVVPLMPSPVANTAKGIRYSYYEGDWDSLPDFTILRHTAEGTVENFSLKYKQKEDHYAFCFEGYIHIASDGVYTFYTDSDDGSMLYIDDTPVVFNDGLHGMQEAKGETALAKGMHAIRVTFFEKGGSDELKVLMKGPGLKKSPVPDNVLFHSNPENK